jgi:Adenylate cyclase, family 3 (some proteins contain HAMP domain)
MRTGISGFIFGDRVEGQLPERVRQAIARQQDQAEILVGWAQLLLIGFFISLYALSPKPTDGVSFRPVPYVLAAFMLVTIVRLRCAYRFRPPAWFLIGLAIVDIALLLGLIWSFHKQYGQPPSFSLKAPTLLYVFIFISLRALRFDATSVIAVGFAAAAGWIMLVGYAIAARGPGSGITRDYVDYLTSNQILIGGEVDKIITILLVTAILAVALIRARRLLIRSVLDEAVARDLTRFVAPEVATLVRAADREIQPGDGEVTTATVLFCDIERFSSISERLDPHALMAMLNDYFAAIAAIVDRERGVITMFQGDATLVTFNSARPNPEHAAAALRTALAIDELTSRRSFGPGLLLRTRCGLSTGEMVSGAVGAANRLYFTVYGDEVNVAARLEQLNKQYGTYVLATERCLAAAGEGFPARAIGDVLVRGRKAPVAVFAPERLPPPTSRS